MTKDEMEAELGKAYRALRGIYGAVAKGQMPDRTMLGYHSPTIAAAARFVSEGALDGSQYFVGKPVEVLHDALKHYRAPEIKGRFDARTDLVPLVETEERYTSSSGDIVIRWGVSAADGAIFVLRWHERGERGATEAGWRVSDQPGIPACVGILVGAVAEALNGPAPPVGRAH